MRKPKPSKKLVIGVTGGFGTGKSTVAGMFKKLGRAALLDADVIAHRVIRPRTAEYLKIVSAFGGGIKDRTGRIDRGKLGELVFSDKKALARLNRIMYPAVIAAVESGIKNAKEKVVILDAPLLFEYGLENRVDAVVVVKADTAGQIARMQKRAKLSKPQIVSRIKSQMDLGKKLRRADFIIDNNGTIGNTRKQVALIRRKLWRS